MQQNIRMLPQSKGLFLQSPLKILTVLVFHVLLKHSCRGQSQVIGPSQPIVAKVGDDVILPCRLEPAVDVVVMTLEWTRPDLNPMFVFVRRAGQDLVHIKHPSYADRTSVSVDELKHGNISLKLSKVKPSDAGTYQCYIPKLNKEAFVILVVGVISSPVISLAGIDRNRGGVGLQCESEGWHPEPEVSWLDSEGHVLSAGPTETVRGPDGLYTVSSRVTVEKRHNNNFTCRVQQKNINQTRETQIHVPDDFFKFQSSSSATTVGLAVCLAVCILVILVLAFFVWRHNRIKTTRSHGDELDGGKNHHKSNESGYQPVTGEEKEQEQLQKEQQRREDKQKRREEAENRDTKLKEEQETKKNELKITQDEQQKFHEEKQKNDAVLQNLKKELDNKNKELTEEKQRGETKLKELKTQLEAKITEVGELKAEVKKITEEKTSVENERQKLQTELKTTRTELEKNKQAADVTGGDLQEANLQLKNKDEEIRQLKRDLTEEKQRGETKLTELKTQLEAKITQVGELKAEVEKLKEEKQTSEQKLQNELETTRTEVRSLTDEVNKLKEEKKNVEQQKNDLETKNQELEKNLQEEMRKRTEAEQQVETLKKKTETVPDSDNNSGPESDNRPDESSQTLASPQTTVTQDTSKDEALMNPLRDDTDSASQTSATGCVFKVEVNQCNNIRIKNTSSEKQKLGGWTLQIQINNEEPIEYTFEESSKLKAGNDVTLWVLGRGFHMPPSNLVWEDLKSWRHGDKLNVTLISNTGQIVPIRSF